MIYEKNSTQCILTLLYIPSKMLKISIQFIKSKQSIRPIPSALSILPIISIKNNIYSIYTFYICITVCTSILIFSMLYLNKFSVSFAFVLKTYHNFLCQPS